MRVHHYPSIPSAWTAWLFCGRTYRRCADGTILVRLHPRHGWTPSVWPRENA